MFSIRHTENIISYCFLLTYFINYSAVVGHILVRKRNRIAKCVGKIFALEGNTPHFYCRHKNKIEPEINPLDAPGLLLFLKGAAGNSTKKH